MQYGARTVVAFCLFLATATTAWAEFDAIGGERVEAVAGYCIATGRGGKDGNGQGKYVAPHGYSIVKAEPVATTCKRCSISPADTAQPTFVSLQQDTGTDYGEAFAPYADRVSKTDYLRIRAVTTILNSKRVVDKNGYASTKHRCHAESHKCGGFLCLEGHDNGRARYDLRIVLRREPTASDYSKLVLSLIEALDRGDRKEVLAILDQIKNAG